MLETNCAVDVRDAAFSPNQVAVLLLMKLAFSTPGTAEVGPRDSPFRETFNTRHGRRQMGLKALKCRTLDFLPLAVR